MTVAEAIAAYRQARDCEQLAHRRVTDAQTWLTQEQESHAVVVQVKIDAANALIAAIESPDLPAEKPQPKKARPRR